MLAGTVMAATKNKNEHLGKSRALQFMTWLVAQALSIPRRLLHHFWVGYVPEFETRQQAEAFWRIKRHYRRRRLFYLNVICFVVIVCIVVLDLFGKIGTSAAPPVQNYILAAMVWLALLWGHQRWLGLADAEDNAIAQIIESYHQQEAETAAQRNRERIDLLVRALSDDDMEALRQRLSSDTPGNTLEQSRS